METKNPNNTATHKKIKRNHVWCFTILMAVCASVLWQQNPQLGGVAGAVGLTTWLAQYRANYLRRISLLIWWCFVISIAVWLGATVYAVLPQIFGGNTVNWLNVFLWCLPVWGAFSYPYRIIELYD
jgi:hypothetical protein